MKHLFEVLTLISSLVCLASGKTYLHSPDLFYECTNDEIIITANNTAAYGSIYAIGTRTNGTQNLSCDVVKLADSTKINFTITNCSVNSSIQVFVMRENQTAGDNMVLGGEALHVYNLKCADIRKGGTNVTKTFDLKEGDGVKVENHHQKLANLSMKLKRENNSLIDESSTVLIGDKLSLFISASDGYIIAVQRCIAKENKTVSAHSKDLIHDGITDDPSLMSNFVRVSNSSDHTNRTETKATLYAFHFLSSNDILIECTITVCENDDDTCPIQNGIGRKRRDVSMKSHTEILRSTIRVVDSKRNDGSSATSGASNDSKPWLYSVTLCALFAVVNIWI